MDRITLDRAVRAFVAEASGLDRSLVIPGNDSGPRPNDPYATVLRMTDTGVGIDSTQYRAVDGDDTVLDAVVKGTREATFSIQFYRGGAYDKCMTLLQYPATPLGSEALLSKGLYWVRASDVRQIDAIVSDQFNERAGVDITVCYRRDITQRVNSVGQITFSVKTDEITQEETVNE